MRSLLALSLACVVAAGAATAQARLVGSTGIAFISGPTDVDAARKRALADALASAAIQGGASLRGISLLDKTRLVKDFTILRTAGDILGFRILSQVRRGDQWELQVEAKVGVPAPTACSERRTLVVTARPPIVDVAPSAPAWAKTAAQRLAQELMETLRNGHQTHLARIASGDPGPVNPALDYRSLTTGRPKAAPGDHVLESRITVKPVRAGARAELTLALTGPTGRTEHRSVSVDLPAPRSGVVRLIAGASRTDGEAAIAKLAAALDRMVEAAACAPPDARIQMAGSELSVPLGTRHGLTPDSLGLTDAGMAGLPLLEIVHLSSNRAVLRPIDRSISASLFDGRRVSFFRSQLPKGAG